MYEVGTRPKSWQENIFSWKTSKQQPKYMIGYTLQQTHVQLFYNMSQFSHVCVCVGVCVCTRTNCFSRLWSSLSGLNQKRRRMCVFVRVFPSQSTIAFDVGLLCTLEMFTLSFLMIIFNTNVIQVIKMKCKLYNYKHVSELVCRLIIRGTSSHVRFFIATAACLCGLRPCRFSMFSFSTGLFPENVVSLNCWPCSNLHQSNLRRLQAVLWIGTLVE